jgi:hypothetical protein
MDGARELEGRQPDQEQGRKPDERQRFQINVKRCERGHDDGDAEA